MHPSFYCLILFQFYQRPFGCPMVRALCFYVFIKPLFGLGFDSPESWQKKLVFSLKLLVESQWKIFVALMPLVIIFFKQVSWVSPISNLVAIPLISLLVVPLEVLAAFTFYLFEPLSSLLFQLADWVLVFYWAYSMCWMCYYRLSCTRLRSILGKSFY